jgi:3-oxoacyl-[acyl-carrier protein] reductase
LTPGAGGMDLGFRDRVVMVVGASRGIGAATARLLHAEGARLVLVARDAVALDGVQRALPGDRASVLSVAADASRPGAIESAVDRCVARFGALHGLAVFAGPAGSRTDLLAGGDELWDRQYHGGLMVSVRACRAALPALLRGTDGAILLTAAYSVRAPKPSLPAYSAMKAAVASLAKGIALEHGGRGLRCNALAPGIILRDPPADAPTGAPAGDAADASSADIPERARYAEVLRTHGMRVALGRAGRLEEFAAVAAFLLSPRASYLTGALLNVDGGTDF